MTDRLAPMDAFEESLGRRLLAVSDRALRPFDPSDVAAQAAAGQQAVITWRPRAIMPSRRFVALLAAAALIGAAIFVGSGGFRQQVVLPVVPSPNVSPAVPSTASPSSVGPSPTARTTHTPTQLATAETPQPSPIGGCPAVSRMAQHAGAVIGGGWTPGGQPDSTSTVTNGLIAGAPLNSPQDQDIHLFDPVAGSESIVTDLGSDVFFRSFKWSPTGANLAYVAGQLAPSGDHECYVLLIWSSDRLTQAAAALGETSVAWSPDESTIAVVAVSGAPDWIETILILPADGSAPRDVGGICSTCQIVNWPMWSPDGTRLAVEGVNSQGAVVSSAVVTVSDGTWTALPTGWSLRRWLDSQTLLLANGPNLLATMNVPAAPAPLGPTTSVPWPPWDMEASPDLEYALSWTGCGPSGKRCGVTVRDRATETDLNVWPGRPGANMIAFFSPDSRSIVVDVTDGAPRDLGLWTVTVDGSDLRRLSEKPANYPVDWQPVWP